MDLPKDILDAGWTLSDDGVAMEKTYRFQDFPAAMAWMVRGAFAAEAMDHHPEWRNVYNRVEVRLTTHDSNGLTDRDVALAKALEAIT